MGATSTDLFLIVTGTSVENGYTLLYNKGYIYLKNGRQFIKFRLSNPFKTNKDRNINTTEFEKRLTSGKDTSTEMGELNITASYSWKFEPPFIDNDIIKVLVLLYIRKVCKKYSFPLTMATKFYLFLDSIITTAFHNADSLLSIYGLKLPK
jgi:hypothetical protein